MSTDKNFRVTLLLHYFFRDHRALAATFVKNEFETIADLSNHISFLYGIREFHLICDNMHLALNEDVRVLQPGDTITVFPNKISCGEELQECNSVVQEATSTQLEISVNATSEKRKKKKHKICDTASTSSPGPPDAKQTKLLPICAIKETEKLIPHYTPARNILPTGQVENKVNIVRNIVIRKSEPILQSQTTDGITATTSKDSLSQDISLKINNCQSSQKNGISDTSKQVSANSHQDDDNKVKETTPNLSTSSLYVQLHQDKEKLTSSLVTKQDNLSKEWNADKNELAMHTDSILKMNTSEEAKNHKSVGLICFDTIDESNNCLGDNASTSEDSPHRNVTKRKRVRSRKKNAPKEHVDSPIPLKLLPKANLLLGRPKIHKFFNDTINESLDAPGTSAQADTVPVTEPLQVDLNNGEIFETKNLTETPILVDECTDKSLPGLVFNGKRITPEIVETLLGLNEQQIRHGDVVLFKIMKLSSEYTAVVSEYIIGKVLSSDTSTHVIRFQILAGLNEFQVPLGKFNLVDEPSEAHVQQEISWQNLIKPCLLGP